MKGLLNEWLLGILLVKSGSTALRAMSSNDDANGPAEQGNEKKVKGILKHVEAQTHEHPEHLVWDEDNLRYNEEHKGNYPKIEEPNTPYRPPLDPSIDPDALVVPEDGGKLSPKSPMVQQPEGSFQMPVFSLEQVEHISAQAAQRQSEMQNEDAKEEGKKRKFAAMRADHYNMKNALALGRRMQAEEDEEEEEGGDVTLN